MGIGLVLLATAAPVAQGAEELKAIEERLSKLERQVGPEHGFTITSLQERNAEQDRKISDLETDLKSTEGKLQAAERLAGEAKSSGDAAREEAKAAARSIETLTTAVRSAEAKIDAIDRRVTALEPAKSTAESATSALSDLKSEVEAARREVAEMKSQVSRLESKQ